jgi:signal peptidase II
MKEIETNSVEVRYIRVKRLGVGLWINIISLLILDQVSKFLIVKKIPLHNSMSVIENFLDITHIRNPGIAFGLFSNEPSNFKTVFMSSLTFLSLILIVYILNKIKSSSPFFYTGLSFILSGAIGNMLDRLFRGGEVIDFIDVHWYHLHWPSFNVADSAITIGVCLLIFDTFLFKEALSENCKTNEK